MSGSQKAQENQPAGIGFLSSLTPSLLSSCYLTESLLKPALCQGTALGLRTEEVLSPYPGEVIFTENNTDKLSIVWGQTGKD